MKYYTAIANIDNSILHIGIEGKEAIRLFAEFLTGDPRKMTVQCLQVASKELKERIRIFDKQGVETYKAKQFFSQIPLNHHFFFLPGRCDDILQQHLLFKQLSHLDGTNYKDIALERTSSILYEHYAIRLFQGYNRLRIGEKDKSKRVCRFCGKMIPDTKFTEKSHAISEALGCKNLICLEECDSCNHRFNESIEQDIVNFFRFALILNGVKGKNGMAKLKGEEISITNDTSSRTTLGRDTIEIKVKDTPKTNEPQEYFQQLPKQCSFPDVKYIPQNIYKCFCKYVISLIDKKYLPYFKGTIDWINEPLKEHRLPPILHYNVPMEANASLTILLRKNNRKEYPYCWAIISIAREQYLFIVPFCSRDKNKFVQYTSQKYLLELVHEAMPHVSLMPIQMNQTKPMQLKVDLRIEIPSECV